jgi:hypothetical protein
VKNIGGSGRGALSGMFSIRSAIGLQWWRGAVASACRLWLIGWSGTGQCLEGRLMHWRRRLAALLVALALAGCAQGISRAGRSPLPAVYAGGHQARTRRWGWRWWWGRRYVAGGGAGVRAENIRVRDRAE